jgi:DNA polymerase-1
MLRAFGERVARNAPIQGTAADIIKIAMIRVNNRLKSELKNSRLILQVHDELIVESDISESEKAKIILTEEMENAAKLSVKLSVDANIGKNWLEAKG